MRPQEKMDALNRRDREGMTPLFQAILNGEAKEVRRLIKAGVDIRKRSRYYDTPLHTAVDKDPIIAKLLIEAGAEIEARSEGGFTPFRKAIRNNCLEAARLLVKHGASIDTTTCYIGNTPLHLACRWRCGAISKWLIEGRG